MGGQGEPGIHWDLDLIEYLWQLIGNLAQHLRFSSVIGVLICEMFVCYEKKMKGDAGVQNTDRISL